VVEEVSPVAAADEPMATSPTIAPLILRVHSKTKAILASFESNMARRLQ
jgi:hypothetical protein